MNRYERHYKKRFTGYLVILLILIIIFLLLRGVELVFNIVIFKNLN